MIFKDASDARAYANTPEVKAKIMMPKLSKNTTKTYRNKYTGFSYEVSSMVPLREAVVPVVIPKAGIKVPAMETDLVFSSHIQEYYYLEKGVVNLNSHLSLKENGEFFLSVPTLDEYYVEDDGDSESIQQDAINIKGQAGYVNEFTNPEGRKFICISGPIEGGGSFYQKDRSASPRSDGESARTRVTEIKNIRSDTDLTSYFEIFYYPEDGYCGVIVFLKGDVRHLEWDETNGVAEAPHSDNTWDSSSISLRNQSEYRSPGIHETYY